MAFYFLIIGNEEYLLEFSNENRKQVLEYLVESFRGSEEGEFLPGDEPIDMEQVIAHLIMKGLVRKHNVLFGKITEKRAFIREAKREGEEPEYCEY